MTTKRRSKMIKHFVTFYSPGTLFSENTKKEIKSWDIELAKKMAHKITERYGATPYGFQFTTCEGGGDNWAPKEIAKSPMYFLGGKVETLAEVKARATENDRILISNMECNHYKKIITNTNSYKSTLPFDDKKDVLLDWTPKKRSKK
jgi:hypothetical protein